MGNFVICAKISSRRKIMKKGISLFFGFKVPLEERVKMIKDAGFTHVITNADKKFDDQNGNIKEQIKLFKKYGLKVSSLHMQYDPNELPFFWEEGKRGDKLTKTLIKDVKLAKKYGFSCVVVHCKGKKYNEIGEERLKKVLKVCEKTKIPLAIENLGHPEIFFNIFKRIKHDYLKFCYDSGHNNAYDKEFDYLTNFSDKLVALHLHDNDGTSDQHTLNKYGNINWKEIGEKLKNHPDIVLDYEFLLKNTPKTLTAERCLKIIVS